MRRRRAQDGYTLIEVMMAIGVLTAGAVGIMALQQAATRGNLEAREMTTASTLAQRWIERLHRDRLNWTVSSQGVPVAAGILTNTTYLKNVTAPDGTPAWFVPTPTAAGESSSFDFYGQDTTVEADMRYCANLRLEWLHPGQAMRADVRVWWVRRSSGAAEELASCTADDLEALTADRRVRMVYATTVLRYVGTRE